MAKTTVDYYVPELVHDSSGYYIIIRENRKGYGHYLNRTHNGSGEWKNSCSDGWFKTQKEALALLKKTPAVRIDGEICLVNISYPILVKSQKLHKIKIFTSILSNVLRKVQKTI